MFILKSTYEREVTRLQTIINKLLDGKAKVTEEVGPVRKLPVLSLPKPKRKYERFSTLKRRIRLENMKKYQDSIRDKVKNGYFRIENGIRISNVTGKPVRFVKKHKKHRRHAKITQ